ncbi:unnamed protein product, partial [marine sediment metagenome]
EESGDNFYTGAGDHADALENFNEPRQILDDLGNLLGHSLRNDLYPKNGATGGYLGRLNYGLDTSKPAVPVVNDMYLATDTTKIYKCFEVGNWIQIYPITEVDPTVDSDAKIKAILVDEVTKTGDFTASRLPEINNSSGIIEQSDIEHKVNGGYDFNANSAGFTTQTAVGDGTTTCDWRIGLKYRFVFGAQNETFTFTNPEFSCHLQVILIQDGTGNRTANWPAGIYWAGGTIPTLSTAGNARDTVNFFFDDYDDVYYGMGIDFAIP